MQIIAHCIKIYNKNLKKENFHAFLSRFLYIFCKSYTMVTKRLQIYLAIFNIDYNMLTLI